MARVVVDVMLKPEILDPQGKAVHGAFGRLGFDGVADVRQGKRFEITLEGDATEERVAEIRKAAETLLANPVIEDFTIHAESDTPESAAEAETDGEVEAAGEAEEAADPGADEAAAEAEQGAESESESEAESESDAGTAEDGVEAEATSEGGGSGEGSAEGEEAESGAAEAGSEQR